MMLKEVRFHLHFTDAGREFRERDWQSVFHVHPGNKGPLIRLARDPINDTTASLSLFAGTMNHERQSCFDSCPLTCVNRSLIFWSIAERARTAGNNVPEQSIIIRLQFAWGLKRDERSNHARLPGKTLNVTSACITTAMGRMGRLKTKVSWRMTIKNNAPELPCKATFLLVIQ